MTDSSLASTIEENEAFENMSAITSNYHARAIKAEADLAIAKELIANQEIGMATMRKHMQEDGETIKLASDAVTKLNNTLRNLQQYRHY